MNSRPAKRCVVTFSSRSQFVKLAGAVCGVAWSLLYAQAQVTATYTPNNWVNDPYSTNAHWVITGANTASPTYTDDGVNIAANLYGYSPIGTTITLANPGDTITMTAQVTCTGTVNNANLQFRLGPVYKGSSANDTDWAGTLIALPNVGGTGLYLEKIPNTAVFSTGSSANIPGLSGTIFTNGSQAGPLNFTISVTYLSATANLVSWTVEGLAGNAFVFAGRYTNTTATAQCGFNFDTVGFLKGGSVFGGSASTTDTIELSNVQVTFGKFGDGAWASDASGNWSTTANWVNGVPANGSGFVADFSQVDLTADRTVTLDSSRNVGSMLIGATSGSTFNWILNSTGGSTLSLNNNGLPGAPDIAVKNNMATLDLSIASTNGLTETGAGTLLLAGNNTIVGPLNLGGGELGFSTLANLPLSANAISAINFGGGGLQWQPGNTLDISTNGIPISFAGNATFDTGANNVTLADNFGDGGVGGLAKLGSGTLTFDGSVAYSGATTISNGVLALGSFGAIPNTTDITLLSNATLNVSALASGLTLNNNETLGGAGIVSGNVSDASGTTIAAGTASAAGTLTIDGDLKLNGSGSVFFDLSDVTAVGGGTNSLIAVSGNLDISGTTPMNLNLLTGSPGMGTYTLFTYGTLTGNAEDLTAPAGFTVVNDAGAKAIELVVEHVPVSLTWRGDGISNIWDTGITANWLESSTNQYFYTGDSVTFDSTGSDTPSIDIFGAVSPGSVTVNATKNYDFTGGGIATGHLTKTNTGTLILENNNTYTGPTVILGGVLQVGNNGASGTTGELGAGVITNDSSLVFDFATGYTNAGAIYGTGSITNIGSAGTLALTGRVSGSTMNMAGGGDMLLTASNSYTGQTVVSSGVLHPENAFALGSGTAGTFVSNGAQLYIDVNVNISNKPISLAGAGPASNGALRKGGAGVSTVGGVITLTADTQIQVDGNSTLNLSNAAGINAPGINLTLGADAGGVGNITGPLNLGAGVLTVQDAGTWTIAPTNTYTGTTILNGGTLDISAATALGPVSGFTASYVTLNGGILGVTTNVTFADGLKGFTVSGTAGGFDVAGGSTLVISNQISGSGTLAKSDSGTLVLSGSNTFSGTLDVDSDNNVNNDGVVVVANPNAIANVATPIALQNSLGGASTFEVNGSNGNIIVTQDITLTGRSPNIAAILSAIGTNTLAGNFTGGGAGPRYIVECDSGLLNMGSSGTLLTFSTTDPQTFTFQGSGSISVLGVIADGVNTASIEKDGTGTLTLAALNTNSGSTTVTGGALIVNGATGTGVVTVSGGALGGTGTVNGPVTIQAGGTLAPGAPFGALTLNSSLTLAGNTFIAVNGTSQAFGKVAGATNIAYGGALTISNLSGALAAGETFQIFPATAFTGNFTSVAGMAGSGLGFTFNPTNGTLSVVATIPTAPTNLTYSVSAGSITFNWPSAYTGWILQAQTNAAGIGPNWFNVAGSSATNQVSIPIDPANPAVFFRLEY
jgi:autotransporter-associated beta strand protein